VTEGEGIYFSYFQLYLFCPPDKNFCDGCRPGHHDKKEYMTIIFFVSSSTINSFGSVKSYMTSLSGSFVSTGT
jgi:hypothetical protein